ncbi:Stk1 family PASTA domain-containing Ser/Thr kinase [Irregularibacter muris]|uniref:non-specific serine/threonine protein kinase n=1 Tax=Irregularibacter muris TaxID=1796619 RepID=A0AAE3HD18_9FIRM|nr:Stk1 family PASTA domain-containing Ser/Thr kinase [Irregularibacter muris]MCR1898165.1 Stk1 family PASTA domain-containing Ser/Thr kinase [Irregularibacter muris]
MLVGKLLGNRYELIEEVGQGGMAIVYRAKDQLLNRFVAVKILRQEFIHDEQFIKKFKRESQAAASLSHPNVVNIYDVGVQENIHYIVMELVKGKTLKEYIVENKKLSWEKAVDIAIQIASALDHAHKNHIIHRDIKPHNIIITNDNMAKVTDFGIARAITSSTLTQVEDTMGSVHYFSPEQARGGFVNEKSDLYSLGIVLYEMVIGEVPFNGETSVSVALQHLQGELMAPIEKNNTIPEGLNEIIMRLLKKNSEERYPNAQDLIKDLKKILVEPNWNTFKKFDENAPTQITPIIATKESNNELKKVEEEEEEIEEIEEEKNRKNKRKRKWIIIFSLVAFFVLASILGALAVSLGDYFMVKEIEVPNVEGKNIDEAMEILSQEGLKSEIVERKYDNEVEKDNVISQNPQAGKKIKENQTVGLIVSEGVKFIPAPNLQGKSEAEAISRLENLGLDVGEINYEFNDKFDRGIVYDQSPKDNVDVREGSKVDLYISKGKETIVVPSVVGMHLEDAKKALSAQGLNVGEIDYKDDEKYKTDYVIQQSPEANGEVAKNSFVNITLSRGKTSTKNIEVNLNEYEKENGEQENDVVITIELLDYQDNTSKVVYEKKHAIKEGVLQIPVKGTGFQIYTVKIDNQKFAEGFISF